jgi:hypothetical protein
MSILDDSALKQNTNAVNSEQLEAIKGTLDAMKFCAFLAAMPGLYSVVLALKLIMNGVFNLNSLAGLIIGASYIVAGVTTYFAARAYTDFSYSPNAQDFQKASDNLKITWLAWSVWAVIATLYVLYMVYMILQF